MDFASLLNAIPGAIGQGLIWGIMAIGLYITYRVLDFSDLTVDGTMATGAVVFIIALCDYNLNIWIAMVLAFLAGMAAGLMTGIFHTQMGIPPILSGILTQLSLYSINLLLLGNKANRNINTRNYDVLVSMRDAGKWAIDNPIFITLAILIVLIALLYWFFGTETGCALRATGCNQAMARAQGINTKVAKVIGLMVANGLVALSSAMLAQFSGTVDVKMGSGAIVIGLAAIIIGEALFGKLCQNFAFTLSTAVLGTVIYYVVINLVIQMGLPSQLMKLLTALVVAVFLAVPYWKNGLPAFLSGFSAYRKHMEKKEAKKNA